MSGMDAGKIYNTWPLMGNSYFPDDNKFISLFKLSVFSDPSLVQYLHRNLAYLIFIIFAVISYITYRNIIFYLSKALGFLNHQVFYFDSLKMILSHKINLANQ